MFLLLQLCALVINLTPVRVGNVNTAGFASRWLALHNSSISVTDLIEQINRPDEKAAYQAAQDSLSTSIYGSTQNFIEYIKIGMLLLFALQLWLGALSFSADTVSTYATSSLAAAFVQAEAMQSCTALAWQHNLPA